MKTKLINLYLKLKIRKLSDINTISQNDLESEISNLNSLPINDIISYITNSIDILLELKSNEKFEEKMKKEEEKKNYKNYENPNDINGLLLYEGMLIHAEKEIRNHIKVS